MSDQANIIYRTQLVDSFLEDYAERFNKSLKNEIPDVTGTSGSFAECFIEAGPSGVQCGKNDEQFLAVIPKGYEFYKSIGISSMEIISKEIMLIDLVHAMVKVHWKSNFLRKDNTSGSIEFNVTYLIQTRENGNKIFAYITGDEQKALRENNLV